MSDDQIRALFQNADPWLPDDSAVAGTGAGAVPGPGTATAAPTSVSTNAALPQLRLGSDVEMAGCVSRALQQDRGEVIFSEGHFWYYTGSHWRPIENHELRGVVHRYDGAAIAGGGPVKLNKTRIDSILNEMSAMLTREDFFNQAPVGINCASGFIDFAPDGTPRVLPHQREHRCRHVLGAFFKEYWPCDDEKLFLISEMFDELLARLIEGVFRGDPDAREKRQLLAEIAGAAALGYRSKSWEPKAVILEGKTAENGKSQVLDLFRSLLPSEAISSIPAANMGDERFRVRLVGKHLNASDELSGAEAIASEVFKAVVTGEPISGRDVYRSVVDFRSVAQNVFATNTLPTFKGGMDRGVQRRLLVLTFNRTIPAAERVANIGTRVGEEEADILLSWAVAGASRLIRQRGFTVPPSSKTAFREWLHGADPVLAWMQVCVEVVEQNSPDWEKARIKSRDAHAAFISWAKSEGFRENTLMAVSGFIQRLRANCPSIGVKHTRAGNFLTGIRLVASVSEPEVADFFAGRPR